MDIYLTKLTDDDLSCFKEALITLENVFKLYKDQKDIEIEFRFGFFEDGRFNSNVPEIFYKKIFDQLNSSEKFTKINKETLDTFSSGLRKSKDILKNRSVVIKKEKLASFDFSLVNTPFDIRVSVSKETKVLIKDFIEDQKSYKRHKNRSSFIYKKWSFDLTEVSYEENSVPYKLYEIELEIDLKNESDIYYLIHSSLLKVRDLALFCEDEGPTTFKLIKQTMKN